MTFLIPAGAAFFDKSLSDIGLLGLVLSLKAMIISLIYNRLFDHLDARRGRVSSGCRQRVTVVLRMPHEAKRRIRHRCRF